MPRHGGKQPYDELRYAVAHDSFRSPLLTVKTSVASVAHRRTASVRQPASASDSSVPSPLPPLDPDPPLPALPPTALPPLAEPPSPVKLSHGSDDFENTTNSTARCCWTNTHEHNTWREVRCTVSIQYDVGATDSLEVSLEPGRSRIVFQLLVNGWEPWYNQIISLTILVLYGRLGVRAPGALVAFM